MESGSVSEKTKSRTRDRKEARFILTQDRDIEVRMTTDLAFGPIKHQILLPST
jgi:hypothetical protein